MIYFKCVPTLEILNEHIFLQYIYLNILNCSSLIYVHNNM